MSTAQEANVVNINGTEYKYDDLNQNQLYLINQIRDLQTKAGNIRFQLDQVTAAQDVFTNMLIQSVETAKEQALAEVDEQKAG
jgi:hypothetical protein